VHVVVAAVIRDGEGRFLVARRPVGRHLGGLWEFPGGRVEPGEAPSAALQREIEEELGVDIEVDSPLTFGWHSDATRDVLVLFFRARLVRGLPYGREGQEVRWVDAAELARLPMPPADDELVRSLARTAEPAREG